MGLLVGLTGTMGSGKTTAASLFKEMGAHIIDADAICRDLVLFNRPAFNEIVDSFGPEILHEDHKSIDRAKLAHIIFNDQSKKEQLEKILHPKVFEEEKRLAARIFTEHPETLVVIEAALLIESGNHQRMDKVIVVTCEEEQSIQRAMKRLSLSREEAISRIKNQMPQAEKILNADYVLQNDGDQIDFKIKVRTLYLELQALT